MRKFFTILFVCFLVVSVQAQETSKNSFDGKNIKSFPIAEGWAKNQINAIIFRKNSVTSFKKNQYAAFYDKDSKVVVAKRKLGAATWEIKQTTFVGNTKDAHNSISVAVDGKGFLHLSWGMHNAPLNYSRSLQPDSLAFLDKLSMTGANETKITYPEFYNLPDGNLLFFFRDGASGNGNLILNFYDANAQKWIRRQTNLIDGEGKRNAYPQASVDEKGTIHLSWVWRDSPDVASNHDLAYAKSTDGGKTWRKSSGERYELPININNAELIWQIPQNSELINQTSMTADERGNAFIATYWRNSGSTIPQYQLVYFDGKTWKNSQITKRETAFSLSGAGTKRIPISRPQVLVDGTKVFVVFRDVERGNRVSAAMCDDLQKSRWQIVDLNETDVGMWEPSFDQNLWQRKKILSLFVQKVGQGDGEQLEEMPPQMISILDWKPY